MKKTYYGSAVLPIIVFVVGTLWEFVFLTLQGTFWVNRVNYLEFILEWGLFCFLIWSSMMIEMNPPTMTRRFFFLFPSTHNLSEVEGAQEVTATDIYGTDRFTQIRFKNGEKWNLAMFSKKDVKEIMDTVRKHSS